MNRVLVVGGENPGVQSAMAAIANIEQQAVLVAGLAEARSTLRGISVSVVAVDLTLEPPGHPDMADFLAQCKQGATPVPVLALIADVGLAAYARAGGFDDFVVPPFGASEVAVRLQSLLRRASQRVDNPEVLHLGDMIIDLARYEVSQEGRRVELTFKEYELLKFLATNAGKVFSREILLNEVWGYDYFGGTRTVDVHIRRLRSKIENGPISYIDTVRNVGYRFVEMPAAS